VVRGRFGGVGYRTRCRRQPSHRPDAGFTLLEVMISVLIMGVIMTALASFFVLGTRITHSNGLRQTAAEVALDGLEKARGLHGAALLAGRAKCGPPACAAPVAAAAAYLADTERWDAAATTTVTQTLSPTGDTVTLDGITYQRSWYVGKCWQPAGGGTCGADATKPVPMIRVVVAVTWPGSSCTSGVCTHATSGLFSAVTDEPVFR
jgi:prepilin-type N-terminal cleavage/methylation domain-containing protein